MLVGVKGDRGHCIARQLVDGDGVERVCSFGDGNVGRQTGRAGNGHCGAAPVHINTRYCGVVFPSEGVFVFVLPEPLLSDDLHVVSVLFSWNDPHGGVRRKSEDDQPRHDDRWQDVEEHLKRGVVPVDRERADFDMVNMGRVGFNTVAVANHGQEHPAKGEDSNQNGPKHELIIENSEYRIFCYHATTLFNRPCSPSLSVA